MRCAPSRWAVHAGRGVAVALLALVIGACGSGAARDAGEGAESVASDSARAALDASLDASPDASPGDAPGAAPVLPGETATLPHSAPDARGSFRLAGNEPFWSVTILATGLRYTTPDYRDGIVFPSVAPEAVGDTLRWVAITPPPEAHTLEVSLVPSSCRDTMAERTWSHTARVVFDGTALSGCGERAAAASR